MADVLATEEQVEAPVEETEIQPEEEVEESENVSEDEETPTEEDEPKGRGDLSVALRQERELRRQAQEQGQYYQQAYTQLYNQALSQGATPAQAQQIAAPQQDLASEVQFQLKIEKAKELYPELESSRKYQLMVTALLKDPESDSYNDPVKAAKEVFSEIRKEAKAARTEGIAKAKSDISAKEKASTVSTTSSQNSDVAEIEDLIARSKNKSNPKVAREARIELLMRRNK